MAAEHAVKPPLGEFINHALDFKVVFTVKVFGQTIPFTETIIVTWVIMAVLILFAVLATRRLTLVPGKFQVLLEALVNLINDNTKQHLGKSWWAFAPWFGTIALYIFLASIASIFSPVMVSTPWFTAEPPFTIKPPTRDLNVTAALASVTICSVIFAGIIVKGPRKWLRSFVDPMAIMLPITLMEYVVKPLTLALRLFGNIIAAFIIMSLIEYLVPYFVPPIAGLYFEFFDAGIQTVVFVLLSMIYIGEAVHTHDDPHQHSTEEEEALHG